MEVKGINWQCKHVIIAKIKAKSVSNGVIEHFLLAPETFMEKSQQILCKRPTFAASGRKLAL